MAGTAEARLTLAHRIIQIYFDCRRYETPAQISLIACPPYFSQHNAFLPSLSAM